MSHKPLLAVRILPGNNCCLTHTRVGTEYPFDFTELDTESADLDLVIGAAGDLQRSVPAPPAEVAGPVEHGMQGIAQVRIPNEAVESLLFAAPVSGSDADTGNADLALSTRRHEIQLRIENVEAEIRQRTPDGHVPLIGRERRGKHGLTYVVGCFCWPVGIHEGTPGQTSNHSLTSAGTTISPVTMAHSRTKADRVP